jgi:hypothetical protein
MAHRKCEGLEGWISKVQSESNGCGTSNNFSESSNLLVNSINNDGSDVSRIQHGETKQSIIGISSGDVADSNNSGSRQDQLLSELWTTRIEQPPRCSRLPSQSTQTREVTVWPSRPREPQYEWEPSRVVGNTDCGGQSFSFDPRSGSKTISRGENIIEQTECGQTKPALGGDSHGSARGLDYAELCVACDNRTDELRLLGNGVVPATATRAFLTLINETN